MHAKLFIGLLLATSASALRATMRPASMASRPTLRSPAVFLQAEPEAAPAAADLPEGWQMAKDNDGDPYYYNLSTGENTYEKPGGAPDRVFRGRGRLLRRWPRLLRGRATVGS